MSDPPARRPSTGGLPPIRIKTRLVVEDAPSHDETPCVTVWEHVEIDAVPRGWSLSDFPERGRRPQWALQFYDTTPGSDDPDRLRALAERLFNDTREAREVGGRAEPDRIDVWGLPLADGTADAERVARCRAHATEAMVFRNSGQVRGFRIPEFGTWINWRRAIIIVDRPEALWDEGEGGFLEAYWDLQPLESIRQEYGEDYVPAEERVVRATWEELGGVLCDWRLALRLSDNEEPEEEETGSGTEDAPL
ncbi:hypothetical protein CPLU01_15484 [Colletotrichum plurivorum]|uniref:Uncharacterized protein n=1 Tax=Colletotrichum plurivorum TaxID=2175906 RepID=A0A8H6JB82_9PEZI|nr:hypothetical protein CPLU01_15484 [Colletotrichum plurivorum]